MQQDHQGHMWISKNLDEEIVFEGTSFSFWKTDIAGDLPSGLLKFIDGDSRFIETSNSFIDLKKIEAFFQRGPKILGKAGEGNLGLKDMDGIQKDYYEQLIKPLTKAQMFAMAQDILGGEADKFEEIYEGYEIFTCLNDNGSIIFSEEDDMYRFKALFTNNDFPMLCGMRVYESFNAPDGIKLTERSNSRYYMTLEDGEYELIVSPNEVTGLIDYIILERLE